MDFDEIRKWHSIFKPNNELFEIRILGDKTYSAYFTDIEEAIKQLPKYDNSQIYFTVNKVNDACASRKQFNNFMLVQGTATSKNDITRRLFIPIDIDVERPSGICSTNEEKEYAHQKALNVFRFLKENNFAEPVICDSSSGYHIYYPVDMEADQQSESDVKKFFGILSNFFTDERVKIDKQVGDANRIMRLSGTWSRKGRNTAERPHRMAKILRYPTEMRRMSREELEAFIDKYEIKEEQKETFNTYHGGARQQFDLRKFIEENNIEVAKETPWENGGTKFVLKECPFDHTHLAPDSAIFLSSSGAIAFRCLHNSCSCYDWRALRLKFDQHAYDKKEYEPRPYTAQPQARQYVPQKPRYTIKEESEELGKKWLSMSAIKKVDLSSIESMKTGYKELDSSIVGLNVGEVSILSGSNSCVDCDTEYFNGKEWKKISEYQDGEMVLQYQEDGYANLVYPLRYIKEPCKKLHLMKSVRGVNQCVSDEHNIVYRTSRGNLAKKQMRDFIAAHNSSKNGFSGKLYTTFRYNGKGIELTDEEIRVMCAVICDGSFSSRFKDKSIVKLNIKKEKKKERLEQLLKNANIEFRKEQYNPKDKAYNTYFFKSPRIEKEFGEYWYDCNAHQLSIIADEIMYWDGYIRRMSFSQNSKKTIDFIQFAFASIGKRTSIYIDDRRGKKHSNGKYVYKNINYSLNICSNNMVSLQNSKKKIEIIDYTTKDGYKYCFTVPSGMLVLRRNGSINITGNSGKSSWINNLILNIINQGYKVALWSGELPPAILKTWIQMCAAGKQYLKPSKIQGRYYVPNDIASKIDEWLDGRFYLYNNEYSNKWQQIFNDMNELLKIGVKLFILDNLFSLDVDIFDGDKNNKHKELILEICSFAKKNGIHILLVAHPRKTVGFLRKNDISGTADLTNAVDNVFICHRVNNDFFRAGKEFLGDKTISRFQEFGNVIEIAKNRLYGAVDVLCGMHYEIESRRFKNTLDENIQYGWSDGMTQAKAENKANDNGLPFESSSEEAPF